MDALLDKITNPEEHFDETCLYLDGISKEAVKRVNSYFAPNRLSKLGRDEEPLPVNTRQLSSYRTRLGTMLEYALSTELQYILEETFQEKLYLTFAVAHEYPDFYLRDKELNKLLRIEMKAVDADSDEQAARFDVLTNDIDPKRDFLFFVGWEWVTEKFTSGKEWEHPNIFAHVIIPAIEIAMERDKRLLCTGGRIEGGKVLVPSTSNPGQMCKDPGNFGKFWRIVPRDRRNASDLSYPIKKFLDFQKEVNLRAPRDRFK